MYRIGFGAATKAPYILTPHGYYIKIDKFARVNLGPYAIASINPQMLKDIRELTIQDIDLINDFEFTKNEEALTHVRKAVEQCFMK